MNWYREYQAEWKEIIETVARELGRSEQMVEKDSIQSIFLFELAKSELPFVFKGGTSLSKVYNLIDRFSEDIDLSMNRRPTQSERVKSKELIIVSHNYKEKRNVPGKYMMSVKLGELTILLAL